MRAQILSCVPMRRLSVTLANSFDWMRNWRLSWSLPGVNSWTYVRAYARMCVRIKVRQTYERMRAYTDVYPRIRALTKSASMNPVLLSRPGDLLSRHGGIIISSWQLILSPQWLIILPWWHRTISILNQSIIEYGMKIHPKTLTAILLKIGNG